MRNLADFVATKKRTLETRLDGLYISLPQTHNVLVDSSSHDEEEMLLW